jgi:hypothetical protein
MSESESKSVSISGYDDSSSYTDAEDAIISAAKTKAKDRDKSKE